MIVVDAFVLLLIVGVVTAILWAILSRSSSAVKSENQRLRRENAAYQGFVNSITRRVISEAAVDPALIPMSTIIIDEADNLRKEIAG